VAVFRLQAMSKPKVAQKGKDEVRIRKGADRAPKNLIHYVEITWRGRRGPHHTGLSLQTGDRTSALSSSAGI